MEYLAHINDEGEEQPLKETQPALKNLLSQEIKITKLCPRMKEQFSFFKRVSIINLNKISEENLIEENTKTIVISKEEETKDFRKIGPFCAENPGKVYRGNRVGFECVIWKGCDFLTKKGRYNVKGENMILYHGSRDIVEYPEIRKAIFNKDFYFGFYCTAYRNQAERWATRYGKKGYINKYEYTPDNKLKYLRFDNMTEEWLDFIVACRLGTPHTFDIVEGPMADDAIFNYVQNFIDKKISRAAFWELAKFNHPTHQISFHTISALNTLSFKESEVVYGNKK